MLCLVILTRRHIVSTRPHEVEEVCSSLQRREVIRMAKKKAAKKKATKKKAAKKKVVKKKAAKKKATKKKAAKKKKK